MFPEFYHNVLFPLRFKNFERLSKDKLIKRIHFVFSQFYFYCDYECLPKKLVFKFLLHLVIDNARFSYKNQSSQICVFLKDTSPETIRGLFSLSL